MACYLSAEPKADIIRIKFQEGEYEISKEVEEGIIVDMAKDITIGISN